MQMGETPDTNMKAAAAMTAGVGCRRHHDGD
jgi:hypothetical protein